MIVVTEIQLVDHNRHHHLVPAERLPTAPVEASEYVLRTGVLSRIECIAAVNVGWFCSSRYCIKSGKVKTLCRQEIPVRGQTACEYSAVVTLSIVVMRSFISFNIYALHKRYTKNRPGRIRKKGDTRDCVPFNLCISRIHIYCLDAGYSSIVVRSLFRFN